jgi:hypothetical protein
MLHQVILKMHGTATCGQAPLLDAMINGHVEAAGTMPGNRRLPSIVLKSARPWSMLLP